MDEQEKQKLIAIRNDFNRYCKNNLKILDKYGKLIPLVPNEVQQPVVDHVIWCLENEQPIRVIVLKARQEGLSTIIEALIYWWTATHKHVSSKIVAHEVDAARNLYRMFQRYYDYSNPIFQPARKYHTKTDLTFDRVDEQGKSVGLSSKIDIATAENTDVGRSQTITWLHGSEVAFWRDGGELVAGLLQTVPDLPGTAIFLESTANGMGGYFYATWQQAKKGESNWKPFFFGWHQLSQYRLKTPPLKDLTDYEKEIKRDYNLDDEQIAWRRRKIKEFNHDPEKFKQEYPINDVEAFLASGRPRFDIPSLARMEKYVFKASEFELDEKDGEIKPRLQPNAPLQIWELPNPAAEYVIGADVAEGVNGDYSVATVMDKIKMKTVARWRGDIEPADFGDTLRQLGKFYNNALIGVESNNHGLTTIQRLRDVRYNNLFRRERGIDERVEKYTAKLGWRTDVKTKPLMIDHLATAIKEGTIEDYDPVFVRECMTYVIDDRGRTNAQEEMHDDTVIATAIALQMFEWSVVTKGRQEIKSRKPSRLAEKKANNRKLVKNPRIKV